MATKYQQTSDIMSSVGHRALRGVMVVVSWFVIPYSTLNTVFIRQKKLPPIRNKLLEIPAIELAKMIRMGQVKCEEVIEAYINRCKEVNPYLNAIVEDRFDIALEEARKVDQLIASGVKSIEQLERDTPLLGLPITVKESISVTGMINQGGKVFKPKRIATIDSPAVAQVKQSGGIILLVSNTPELCMNWETYNKVSGLTKNPHDLKRTPGGSSGGEAALLGCGASLLSLSSDIAGSARLPAMFTGVFGHKPSSFVVSPTGHMPGGEPKSFGKYFSICPMTRYAVDLPLLLNCMADPNGTKIQLTKEIPLSQIKFYYADTDGTNLARPLARDVRKAFESVVNHFNAERVDIKELKNTLSIALSQMLRIDDLETIYNMDESNENKKSVSLELLKYLTGMSDSVFTSVIMGHLQAVSNAVPKNQHNKYYTLLEELKASFSRLLGSNGVFIYPTFPTTAHKHYRVFHKLLDTVYLMAFNITELPATNCTVGMDRNNLPIGVQVAANHGHDHLCLIVAKEIEKRFGGWIKPPSHTN